MLLISHASFQLLYIRKYISLPGASLVVQTVKNLPAMQETWVWFLSWEDILEEEMTTDSSIPAWRIPQTEEPGGLQSMGLQRVEHNWVNNTHIPPCYIYFTEILSYYRYWTLSQWLLYLASTARWRDTISPFQVHDCKPANRLIAKSSRWDLTQMGGSGVQKKATMQRFLCKRESGWI